MSKWDYLAGLDILYYLPLAFILFLVGDFFFLFFVKCSLGGILGQRFILSQTLFINSAIVRWFFFSYLITLLSSKYFYTTTPTFIFSYSFVIFMLWGLLMYKNLFSVFLLTSRASWLLVLFFLSIYIIYSFFFISNLISFLLLLEAIATLYYFFFLTFNTSYLSLVVKYKYFLLLYIIVSFFTTLLLALSIIGFSIYYGTISFQEIAYFNTSYTIPNILLLVSILWKLGSPGFHFFKLEFYQYLLGSTLILFSLFSLFLNVFLLYFILYFLGEVVSAELTILLYFSLVSIILLLTVSFRYTTFSQFIAYSTFSTIILILISCVYG